MKEEDSRDIEECIRKINSLVEDDFIASQEAPTIEDEVTVEKEDVRIEVVNEKADEDNTTTEPAENESVEDIDIASEFVDTTKGNLEQDGARPAKSIEVTREEHHNSLAIVVSTGPLQVTPPTQEAVDDVGAMPKTEEQSEDSPKLKEKKRKCSKDKKCKKEEKKRRKKNIM
ncbi:hypothetical protein V6Z12_D13G115700 [Gossypium hirsutum]